MKPSIIIEDAQITDLADIVEIYNETIPGRQVTADVEPVTPESREAWFSDHVPGKYPLWVVRCDGQVAAWLSFQAFHDRPAYRNTSEISIYVSELYRRRGLASMLLGKALDEAPSLGVKTLIALIFAHNAPSRKLFETFGFDVWGQLPRVAEMDDREYDLLFMGKRVD